MANLKLFSHSASGSHIALEGRWAIYRSKTSALIGLFGLIVISLMAITTSFNEHQLPAQDADHLLIPPAWHEQGSQDNLLGTDLLGRDIFLRLIEGAPHTLGTSILSVSAALFLGVGLGLLAAYFRGYVQLFIMRTMDIIFAIPSLLLAIIVVSFLGASLVNAGLAVMIVLLPNFVRTTVNYVIEEMQKPYVDAARLDGAKPVRILLHAVFPNIAAPLTLQTTIALSTAVVDIALLGFLGFGAQAPLPEWGAMLADARTTMHFAPWAVISPGFAILLTVLCINFIGDGMNRVISHKLRH